ncbi:MAG: hypothetical protein ACRDFS_11775, partial [Chloroflexota bacterium]
DRNRVAYARYAQEFAEIDDPSALDFDSYHATVNQGEIAVFRNRTDSLAEYALIQVNKVLNADRGDKHFELCFDYELRLREVQDTD